MIIYVWYSGQSLKNFTHFLFQFKIFPTYSLLNAIKIYLLNAAVTCDHFIRNATDSTKFNQEL